MMEGIPREEQVAAMQQAVAQAKETIALRDMLEQLDKNKAFKKLIKDEYLNRYARRQVELLADPSMQNEQSRTIILNALEGISQLNYWLVLIGQEARRAEYAVQRIEEELDVFYAEEEVEA